MKKKLLYTVCFCCMFNLLGLLNSNSVMSAQIKTVRGELSFGYSGGGATSVTARDGSGVTVLNSSKDGQWIQQVCYPQLSQCEVTYSLSKNGKVKVLKVRKIK